MESAKEKAIREAYGEHWDKWKHKIDENGWYNNSDDVGYLSFGDCKGTPLEECEYFEDLFLRPKTLQGIETNNGWDLTSEKLPSDLKCYVCLENGKIPIIAFYTKGHEVGFEDWDDYEEYDEVEERDGTLYLKPGWYEECEQQNSAYDTIYFKRNITHWMSFPNLPIY